MGSFYVINTAVNGLETGALILIYAVIWRWYQRQRHVDLRQAAVLGALLGLASWVRIDALVVAGVFALAMALRRAWKRAATLVMVALATVSPWLLYNLILLGSPVPSGGQAQTAIEFSWFRLGRIVDALAAVGLPWTPIPPALPAWTYWLRACAAMVLVMWAVVWGWRSTLSPSQSRTMSFGGTFLAGYLVLAAYYATTSFAYWFYGRYLAPIVIVPIVILGVLLVQLAAIWRVSAAIALTFSVLIAVTAHWTERIFPPNPMFTEQVALVSSVVPPDTAVGAWQSGTLGFWRERVINLDGKVNPEALELADHGLR